MTLIELLVVIVILTTLVGGVLPLVSPNNDTRKISEGVRSLQTYFMQAQAEAARIGRPVGVGFRETNGNTGVALEAYQLLVPAPYYGSSELSRVSRVPKTATFAGGGPQMEVPADSAAQGLTYGPRDDRSNPYGNEKTMFPDYYGAKLYAIHTELAPNRAVDSLPPKMFRIGDIIEAEGHRFVIVDDPRNIEYQESRGMNQLGIKFLDPRQHPAPYTDALVCIRLDEVLQGDDSPPLSVPPTGYGYAIHRQPMGYERTDKSPQERIIISGGPPLQLPSAISIDLQASGFEADGVRNIYDFWQPIDVLNKPLPYSFGIMFSPNGGVDSVWISGQRYLDISKIFLLIGRQENGNPPAELYTEWGGKGRTSITDNELKDRRSKVNWLSGDSRWLLVNAIDGRISVSGNAVFDPRTKEYDDELTAYKDLHKASGLSQIQLERNFQIEQAHGLSHGHSSSGGTRGGTN